MISMSDVLVYCAAMFTLGMVYAMVAPWIMDWWIRRQDAVAWLDAHGDEVDRALAAWSRRPYDWEVDGL